MENSTHLGKLSLFRRYCLLMIVMITGGMAYASEYSRAEDDEPVAKIGSNTYLSLTDAVNAATTGQTVQIIAAGNYSLPAIPNITVEGAVEGVVFNHTGSGNIASIANGATFKNVTFNLGNNNYHGFQHAGAINMEGCTLNGKLFSYGKMVFTNCNFVQTNSDYNMWCYSGDVTYNNCTFTNQVTGKFLNVYNEDGATKYNIVVNGCKFINNGGASKAALNVKSTSGTKPLSYDVTITNCTTTGSFPAFSGDENSALIVFDPLVQVDDRNNATDALKVTLDGTLKYENSVPYLAPKVYVAQLGSNKYETLQEAVTAAKSLGGEQTITLLDDISGEVVTIQEVANFKLTIDGKKNADSNYTVDAQIIVDGLRGNGGSTTNGASVTLQNMAFVNSHNGDAIQATHYPHNLTIQDCTYTGTTASLEKYFFNASVDGPLYGVTIKDVTVENARLIYANLADDALFENIVATTGATVGFNVKTSGTALIKNCQVTTAKYSFRDYKDGYEGTFTLEGNTFVSTSEASDEGVIVNRGGEVGTAHINVLSGTYTGHIKVLNNKEGVLAISGGHFSQPVDQAFCADGYYSIPNLYVNETPDVPHGVTNGIVRVTQNGESTLYTSLQEAFNAAQDGAVVTPLIDIDATSTMYAGDPRFNLWISKSITLDGEGKTITVKGRGIGIKGADSKINVTIKDATIKNVGNANGRCVDTRGNLASLTLDNTTLTTAESTYIGFLQPLTIGGNQAEATNVKILNGSEIIAADDANKGYAITTFNPVNMTIDESTIKGWACLNLKAADSSAGSAGSVITVTNSTLVSANGYSGDSNAYSLIKIEDDNVNVDITGSTINVNGENNTQSLVLFQKVDNSSCQNSLVTMRDGNDVTFEGDFNYSSSTGDTSRLAISGGIFNKPVPEDDCADGYVPVTLEEGKYSVEIANYVAQIGETKYVTLQAALDAAHEMTGDVTILLIDDITGYALVHQKAGLNLTINGDNKTVAGQIIIDGDGRASGTETLTIQNVKFEGNTSDFYTGTDAFILVPSTTDTGKPWYTNKHNYAHNITIVDCSFNSTDEAFKVVGFKSTSSAGMYNLSVLNTTGNNLHSLAQLTGTTGATFDNCSATMTGSFIGVNGGGGEYTVSNCSFESHPDKADGYAFREKSNSTANTTLINNNFKAYDAIILGSAGTITVVSGTYVGEISKTAGTVVLKGGEGSAHYSAHLSQTKYDALFEEGYIGIENLYPDDTVAPNGIAQGTYVASVSFDDSSVLRYTTFASAAEAADGKVITLLQDVSERYTMSVGEVLKVEKDGHSLTQPTSPSNYSVISTLEGAVTIYTLSINQLPADIAEGYYRIKNLGNDSYVNVLGRRTATVSTSQADALSLPGTVLKVKATDGVVEILRSQAVDLPYYAQRAMSYVPDVVELVVSRLGVDGSGEILGSTGVQAILDKFYQNFDYHLHVETVRGVDGGIRIYGKTPSMTPVREFYQENKAKVDAKLPSLESEINEAIRKIVEKAGTGSVLLNSFKLVTIWERMGGTLTQPVDDASKLAFLQEVLENEENIWNFAYQTATFYMGIVENKPEYFNKLPEEIKNYWNLAKQVRPDFKYYIVQKDGKMDFISEGNVDILENNPRAFWTLESVTDNFVVNFPENIVNKDGEYFTTLYTDFGYQLPEGVTALKVTAVDSEGVAQTEVIGNEVPAQTPVLLKSTTSGGKTLTVGNYGSAVSGNLLHGADWLINEYEINSSFVEGLFQYAAMASQSMAEQYEYLQRLNSGTVNNKYFFSIKVDGTLSDAYKAKTGNEMENSPIRILGSNEEGDPAFNLSWNDLKANEAFVFNEEFESIPLNTPKTPDAPATIEEGYYRIKNLGNGNYVNVIGRRTAMVNASEADTHNAAGTVIKVKATDGTVEILRSQAVDIPHYAQRAMSYVPDVVKMVVERLGVDGSGEILGSTGVEAIMDKFNASFDYHLHAEYADEEGNLRIYGKTPSMKPVVEFYQENKSKVDAKLPNLESAINEAIAKVVDQVGRGGSLKNSFKLKTVWSRMGGTLTDPDVNSLQFLQEVLSSEANVWNFAYQTATYYMEIVESHEDFFSQLPAEIKNYWNLAKQVRPDFKYYIVQKDGKMDIISEGNIDITSDNLRTMWTIEPVTEFTVNIPEENSKNRGTEFYTTLYTDFGYTLPEGVTALKVSEVNEVEMSGGIGLAKTEEIGSAVAPQTPVLLKSDKAGDISLTIDDTSGSKVTDNLLHGADWLINEYEINSSFVEGLFQYAAMASQSMADQYDYLQRLNSGTVNNKYFFSIKVDGTLSDAYKAKTGNEMEESPIRILGKNGNCLAFWKSWDDLKANGVFIFSENYNPVLLSLIGDVDRDGDFDIDDVTAQVNIILGKDKPADNYDYEAADVEIDDDIDIDDVTNLVDVILGKKSLKKLILGE